MFELPSFSGVTGTVYINDNGDRIADYALLDMDPEDGKFKVAFFAFHILLSNAVLSPRMKWHLISSPVKKPPG